MARPRSFDEGELLDAAIDLFWGKGYQAASLTDLSGRTGVANGSLYQAFGSKSALFLAAFRRYCARRSDAVSAAVAGEYEDVSDVVDAYFDAIVRDCIERSPHAGCLMLNTIAELGEDADVVAVAAETVQKMYVDVGRSLAAVTGRSETDDAVKESAVHVVALSQAMIHLSRAGQSSVELRAVGRQAAAATRSALAA